METEKMDGCLDSESWNTLKNAVTDSDLISTRIVSKMGWKVVVFDDNVMADEEVNKIEDGVKHFGLNSYYSIPTKKLAIEFDETAVRAYHIDNENCWKMFFKVHADGSADYLEDNIFFSLPINFLILRTGETRHTIYAGASEFLKIATGIELNNNQAISVGSYWPDKRIHNQYKPFNIKLNLPSSA